MVYFPSATVVSVKALNDHCSNRNCLNNSKHVVLVLQFTMEYEHFVLCYEDISQTNSNKLSLQLKLTV